MTLRLLGVCLCVFSGMSQAAPLIPAQASSYDAFPVSKISVPEMEVLNAQGDRPSVRVFDNVVYAQKSNTLLHLTIIRPEPREPLGETLAESNYPVIAYVQGSAWFKQNLGHEVAQLSRFAARGYVVAIIEYRPSTTAPFPAQVEDAKTALHYLKVHAKEYGGDANQLILWGDSSGGHTVSMVAVTLDTQIFDNKNEAPIAVKAVIDYYGPTALSKMNEEPSIYDHIQPNTPEGMLLGGVNVLENLEKAKQATPMTYISKKEAMPPFLIVHGDKDRLVPFGQSAMLFRALRDLGHQARLIKLHGADHGGAPFWQDDILDIVDNFIQANLD